MGLVLARLPRQSVVIKMADQRNIEVVYEDLRKDDSITLRFEAPEDIEIWRDEIWREMNCGGLRTDPPKRRLKKKLTTALVSCLATLQWADRNGRPCAGLIRLVELAIADSQQTLPETQGG